VVSTPVARRAALLAVIVAALGYFVDIYDLILFGMIRVKSLNGLGITDDKQVFSQGVYLINMQMGGMLAGGILWGVIGDKRGRLSVLFGSIIMYSLANIANGMVETVDQYAVCRLIAGIGLAGELGAGITLVSELMGPTRRGIGTTVVAALGVSGGVVAGFIGGAWSPGVDWRTAYYIGGGMGLALFALRIGVVESGMFHTTAKSTVSRGNFLSLFTSRKRFTRYLGIILVGAPIWYVIGVMFSFAKEIGGDLGLSPPPINARALFFCYAGCTVGGTLSGLVSQWLRSRKKTLALFTAATGLAIALYFSIGGTNQTVFYALCAFGGIASGYWAVFVSTAAELFGTNLRATVTTTVPNFVRGLVPLLTMSFTALHDTGLSYSRAALIVGVGTLALGVLGLTVVPETFGVDLDYHETDERDDAPTASVA